jgi:hypothetical protein
MYKYNLCFLLNKKDKVIKKDILTIQKHIKDIFNIRIVLEQN